MKADNDGKGRGLYCVVTTIQTPTPSMELMGRGVAAAGGRVMVVGDAKGPAEFRSSYADFYSLETQEELDLKLARLLPTGTYTRKNLGYLLAMRHGAGCIYETDDDNAPLDAWAPRRQTLDAEVVRGRGWTNAYRAFTETPVWPRGFPLAEVRRSLVEVLAREEGTRQVTAPIQQGLATGEADVDAICRLVQQEEVGFRPGPSLYLPPGTWCPFNSQSTWWWPQAYVLMYLPSHCTFRMTDIWRGLIAQRCLWTRGTGVVFHGPEVYQERNAHDLMKDFADEVPGYLNNGRIAQILDYLEPASGTGQLEGTLWACYERLIEQGIFPREELDLLQAWLADIDTVLGDGGLNEHRAVGAHGGGNA